VFANSEIVGVVRTNAQIIVLLSNKRIYFYSCLIAAGGLDIS